MPSPRIIGRVGALLIMCLMLAACPSSPGDQPDILLIVDGKPQQGYVAVYCWDGVCADGVPPEFTDADYVLLDSGDVRIEIAEPQPDFLNLGLSTEVFGPDVDSTRIEPVSESVEWDVSVPPGRYVLSASAQWNDGDLLTFFAVEIP